MAGREPADGLRTAADHHELSAETARSRRMDACVVVTTEAVPGSGRMVRAAAGDARRSAYRNDRNRCNPDVHWTQLDDADPHGLSGRRHADLSARCDCESGY